MTQINKLLEVAAGEIGVKEVPANSNNVKYNSWYYGRDVSGSAYAWCCTYVVWCFKEAEIPNLWLNGNVRETAYCPYVVSMAKKLRQWVTGGYRSGDVILFDWEGDGYANHLGICESVAENGSLIVIEGNTVAGSGSNGGEVLRRTRELNTVIGAFRPNYTLNDDEMTYEKFKEFMAKYEAEKAELPPKYDLPEFKSAVAKKITDGTRPQSLVSREEVAIMIERAIKT